MKGYKFLPIILLLGAVVLSACGLQVIKGSENVVSETRQVRDFDAVAFSGSGDVIITQGNKESLKIAAEDNLIPYIRTEVRGRTLHIDIDPGTIAVLQEEKPMRFYISMKQVNGLSLSGSGTITSEFISTNNLDIKNSGSGETKIDKLTADSLHIDISGSGNCLIKGQVAKEIITISGSGTCNNRDLQSKDVKIDVSGSGKTAVMATDNLDVTISGSGDVTYTGNPRISQKITGFGKIGTN
jgi:hypothetical protein